MATALTHRQELVLAALASRPGTGFAPVQVQKLFFLIDENIAESIGGKQFAFEPFQVVQNPSLLSFQVPSPLAPDPAIGSRVIFPSGMKTILNFTFEGVADVNGWPLKKVV